MLCADGAQPMKSIGSRDPVIAQVFRITIGSNDLFAGVESVVHTADVIVLQQVVCIENKITIVGINAIVTADLLHKKLQGKALRLY